MSIRKLWRNLSFIVFGTGVFLFSLNLIIQKDKELNIETGINDNAPSNSIIVHETSSQDKNSSKK